MIITKEQDQLLQELIDLLPNAPGKKFVNKHTLWGGICRKFVRGTDKNRIFQEIAKMVEAIKRDKEFGYDILLDVTAHLTFDKGYNGCRHVDTYTDSKYVKYCLARHKIRYLSDLLKHSDKFIYNIIGSVEGGQEFIEAIKEHFVLFTADELIELKNEGFDFYGDHRSVFESTSARVDNKVQINGLYYRLSDALMVQKNEQKDTQEEQVAEETNLPTRAYRHLILQRIGGAPQLLDGSWTDEERKVIANRVGRKVMKQMNSLPSYPTSDNLIRRRLLQEEPRYHSQDKPITNPYRQRTIDIEVFYEMDKDYIHDNYAKISKYIINSDEPSPKIQKVLRYVCDVFEEIESARKQVNV